MKKTEIVNEKNFTIVSWIAIAMMILPKLLLKTEPCAFCLMHRFLFFLLGLSSFLAKWIKKVDKIALCCSLLVSISTLFHLLVVYEMIPTPSFCSIKEGFFNQVLSNCKQGEPLMILGAFIISLVMLILIVKA